MTYSRIYYIALICLLKFSLLLGCTPPVSLVVEPPPSTEPIVQPQNPIIPSLRLIDSIPSNNDYISTTPPRITLRFTRDIVLAQSSLINISGGSGQISNISIHSTQSNRLTLNLSNLSETDYTITIPSNAIEDRSGNPLESEEIIQFTIDATPPVFEGSTPSDFATLEGNRVVLSYSEDIVILDGTAITMSGGPGTITSRSVISNELILELSGIEGGGYFIDIPVTAISDLAGNSPSSSVSLIFFVN